MFRISAVDALCALAILLGALVIVFQPEEAPVAIIGILLSIVILSIRPKENDDAQVNVFILDEELNQ